MPKILVAGDVNISRKLERVFGWKNITFADTYNFALKVANASYDNFIIAAGLPISRNQNPELIGVYLAKQISEKFKIDYEKFRIVSPDNKPLLVAKKLGIKGLYSGVMADERRGFKSVHQLLDDVKREFHL